MHNEMLDILSGKKSAITSEQLLSYLHGNMPDSEKHELEKTLLNSGIDSEALEGLLLVNSKEKIKQYEYDIKKALREKLQQKKNKRIIAKKINLSALLWLTGALLALILLFWFIVYILQAKG